MADQTPDTEPITPSMSSRSALMTSTLSAGLAGTRPILGQTIGFRSLRLHRALNPDSRFQLVNVAEWDSARALDAATARDFFKKSTRRSMHDVAVAAHPALYRVVIEATAE